MSLPSIKSFVALCFGALDAEPTPVDSTHGLPVNVVAGSATGTEYVEDAAAAANPAGGALILVRRDTLSASEVSADGDNVAAKATSKGEIYTHDSDVAALVGGVTETAPATDTASSGLNGRLQRIAQRVTSLIALVPAALGANGGFKIEGVASGTAVPVSGPQTNAQFVAALQSTPTHSSVVSAATSTTILAANANRKGARIFNTDANDLYLDLSGGTAVAATRAQVKLATNTGYSVEFGNTGAITGIWSADGSGVASVVELA